MTSDLLKPVKAAERLPGEQDVMPKLGYCWWWSKASGAWFLCDASYMIDLYPAWLPYSALPDPTDYSRGCLCHKLRDCFYIPEGIEWFWDEHEFCWRPSAEGERVFYLNARLDLRGEQGVSQ